MKNKLIIFATLLITIQAKPNGVYQQQFQYQSSASRYKNDELQHKSEDEAFYSHKGDLEGVQKPLVDGYSSHLEFNNPKLSSNQQNVGASGLTQQAENVFDSMGSLSTQQRLPSNYGSSYTTNQDSARSHLDDLYDAGSSNNGGSSSSRHYSYSSSYRTGQIHGVDSDLQAIGQQMQEQLARQLQSAVANKHRESSSSYRQSSYSSGDTQVNEDFERLKEELKRNMTQQLQRELQGQNGRKGSYTYTISSNNGKFTDQDVQNLVKQMEGNLNNQLLQSVKNEYGASYAGAYGWHINQKPSNWNWTVVNANNQQNSKLVNIGRQLESELANNLQSAIRKYKLSHSSYGQTYSNNRHSNDEIVAKLREDVRKNFTEQFNQKLTDNIGGLKFTIVTTSNGDRIYRYDNPDVENLKRQLENKLLEDLEQSVKTEYARSGSTSGWHNTHTISNSSRGTDGISHYNYSPLKWNYTTFHQNNLYGTQGSKLIDISQQLEGDLSRQLQNALAYYKTSDSYTSSNSWQGKQELDNLRENLRRNFTQLFNNKLVGNSGRATYTIITNSQGGNEYKYDNPDVENVKIELERQLLDQFDKTFRTDNAQQSDLNVHQNGGTVYNWGYIQHPIKWNFTITSESNTGSSNLKAIGQQLERDLDVELQNAIKNYKSTHLSQSIGYHDLEKAREELLRNFNQNFKNKVTNYSGDNKYITITTSNGETSYVYENADVENLRRQMEKQLLQELEKGVRSDLSQPNKYTPQTFNCNPNNNCGSPEISQFFSNTKQLEENLSRQLQNAVKNQRFTSSSYSRPNNNEELNEQLAILREELLRNLTEQFNRELDNKGSFSYTIIRTTLGKPVYKYDNPAIENLKSQLENNLLQELEKDVKAEYARTGSFSQSINSHISNTQRPVNMEFTTDMNQNLEYETEELVNGFKQIEQELTSQIKDAVRTSHMFATFAYSQSTSNDQMRIDLAKLKAELLGNLTQQINNKLDEDKTGRFKYTIVTTYSGKPIYKYNNPTVQHLKQQLEEHLLDELEKNIKYEYSQKPLFPSTTNPTTQSSTSTNGNRVRPLRPATRYPNAQIGSGYQPNFNHQSNHQRQTVDVDEMHQVIVEPDINTVSPSYSRTDVFTTQIPTRNFVYKPIVAPTVSLSSIVTKVEDKLEKEITPAYIREQIHLYRQKYYLDESDDLDSIVLLREMKRKMSERLEKAINYELAKYYGTQIKQGSYAYSVPDDSYPGQTLTANYKLDDLKDLQALVTLNLNTFLTSTLEKVRAPYNQQSSTDSYSSLHPSPNQDRHSGTFSKYNTFGSNAADTQQTISTYTRPAHIGSSSQHRAATFASYGSNLDTQLASIKADLKKQLNQKIQESVSKHNSQYRSSNGQDDRTFYNDLKAELKSNFTRRLENTLLQKYQRHGTVGDITYAITSTNPNINHASKLADFMKRVEMDMSRQLQDELSQSSVSRYSTSGRRAGSGRVSTSYSGPVTSGTYYAEIDPGCEEDDPTSTISQGQIRQSSEDLGQQTEDLLEEIHQQNTDDDDEYHSPLEIESHANHNQRQLPQTSQYGRNQQVLSSIYIPQRHRLSGMSGGNTHHSSEGSDEIHQQVEEVNSSDFDDSSQNLQQQIVDDDFTKFAQQQQRSYAQHSSRSYRASNAAAGHSISGSTI